jgi:hypothetical protein
MDCQLGNLTMIQRIENTNSHRGNCRKGDRGNISERIKEAWATTMIENRRQGRQQ